MNMKRLCFLAVLLIVRVGLSAEPDREPAWPQANGPFGNFVPRKFGHALIDDLKHAKTLWVSQGANLGFAKGSSSGYLRHLTETSTHPGSASGLIVAEGKIFASSFRPTGEVWADKLPHWSQEKNQAILAEEKLAEPLRRNAAIDADDLTVALDLNTGKLLWKAIEAGQGVNRYSGKRNHYGVTPAYFGGRVFSLGTAGRLRCYDAATGKKIWEVADSRFARQSDEQKEKLLRDRNSFAGGPSMSASLIVADGVLIVPQFDLKESRDVPLRGINIEDGSTKWEVPAATCRYATPAVWTHAGRQYVLAATVGAANRPDGGSLRLIDPRDGRVMWTVEGLAPNWSPLSPSDRHVCVNVTSQHRSENSKEPWALKAAYRLSPERAELAWTMPDEPPFWFENQFDTCCMRRVLLRDGRVYFNSQGRKFDTSQPAFHFAVLDEATGRPLYVSPNGEFGHHPSAGVIGQAWLVEDRLLNIRDAAHSDRSELEFLDIDPARVRRLCPPWKPRHENTTAYEVFIELPYVDGRFLMRNRAGEVVCYDLRK